MSLVANIEHLEIAHGIDAVAVQHGENQREYKGDGSWREVLGQALDLFAITRESSIRLVVGDHTIVVQREGEEVAAICLVTGHPIAKSLRRMIRRMSKKVRPPVEQTQSSQANTGPSIPSPAAPSAFRSLF